MGVLINTFLKVFLQFIIMIFNFLYNTLIWTIIDRFSPDDYAMVMVMESITDTILMLIKGKSFKIYLHIISIIIYLILIIGVCIHSEIIIINVFGLSENTKKKLGTKSYEELELTRETNIKEDLINPSIEYVEENN